jgi:hypothetical protein
MRAEFVVCVFLLTACSTQIVRCERHLTPINIPKRPIANALAPGQPERSSARTHSAPKSGGTPRTKVAAEPGAPNKPAPAAGAQGSP